jgi:hypothetical protein
MFNRHKFASSYLQKFGKDYEKSIEGFSPDEQIYITDTLLAVLECYKESPVNYKGAQKTHEELLKKYRSRLKNYNNMGIPSYFTEESLKHLELQYDLNVDDAGDAENFFTEEERQKFLAHAGSFLNQHKKMLYLHTEPEKAEKAELSGTIKTKGKHKRELGDRLTKLNQEQTALLIYCLQKGKLILKDEDLNNKEAGQAFSILTGFSADTLRQNLGKTELKRITTKKNIDAVHAVLTSLTILIDKEIKPDK